MPNTSRHTKRKNSRSVSPAEPAESRASEAITIAWTSAVAGVFVADLIVIAAHLFSRSNPDAQAAKALEAMMLLAAAAMGSASLALLALVWRSRRVKPPQGYVVFAILSDLPQAAHDLARPGAQDLPVFTAECGGHAARPGVGERHHVRAAVEALRSLPEEQQDAVAGFVLSEIESDRQWTATSLQHADKLGKLADEAREDFQAGRTSELDPEKL